MPRSRTCPAPTRATTGSTASRPLTRARASSPPAQSRPGCTRPTRSRATSRVNSDPRELNGVRGAHLVDAHHAERRPRLGHHDRPARRHHLGARLGHQVERPRGDARPAPQDAPHQGRGADARTPIARQPLESRRGLLLLHGAGRRERRRRLQRRRLRLRLARGARPRRSAAASASGRRTCSTRRTC